MEETSQKTGKQTAKRTNNNQKMKIKSEAHKLHQTPKTSEKAKITKNNHDTTKQIQRKHPQKGKHQKQ